MSTCCSARRMLSATDGSSQKMSLLPPSSAMAKHSLRFMPPLSAADTSRCFSCRPTSRSSWSMCACTSASGTSLSSACSSRCSRTVSVSHRCVLYWGQMPTERRTAAKLSFKERPYISASPLVAGRKPVSMLIVVDLLIQKPQKKQ